MNKKIKKYNLKQWVKLAKQVALIIKELLDWAN